MEPTKTQPTPKLQSPPSSPPSSASGDPGGNAVASATGTSPREYRATEKERIKFERSVPAVLRFTPYAWAKLLFFRDAGDTEIGGFGITRLTEDDLLLVEEFVTVKQVVSSVTVAFDDTAVADFFEQQVDLGRKPEQFGRIWCHTHPGSSAMPSSTDEETFGHVFGECDWALMFILAKGGQTYARLRFNVGPGGEQLLKTQVDFDTQFSGSDVAGWIQEYEENIFERPLELDLGTRQRGIRESFSMPRRPRQSRSADEDLQEMLADEYAQFWGAERSVLE